MLVEYTCPYCGDVGKRKTIACGRCRANIEVGGYEARLNRALDDAELYDVPVQYPE